MTPVEARADDRGAAPRFAMASPSIWCRISTEPPFSPLPPSLFLLHPLSAPPTTLSHPLEPSCTLSRIPRKIGTRFLIKTIPGVHSSPPLPSSSPSALRPLLLRFFLKDYQEIRCPLKVVYPRSSRFVLLPITLSLIASLVASVSEILSTLSATSFDRTGLTLSRFATGFRISLVSSGTRRHSRWPETSRKGLSALRANESLAKS